jgi:predicted amidohydrolase YtcJ
VTLDVAHSQKTVAPNQPKGRAAVFQRLKALTLDPLKPRASVLASFDGRLTYVGDDFHEALETLPEQMEAEVVDFKDRYVLPGLIDSHAHIAQEGLRLSQLDLRGLSREQIVEAVEKEAQGKKPGEWIHGRAWDQNGWPGGWPTNLDLDKAAPQNPVVLDRIDKHTIWVNSKALEAAGLTAELKPIKGGEVIRGVDGSLSGIFIGQAMNLIYSAMSPNDGLDYVESFIRAEALTLKYGLTTLIDLAFKPSELPRIVEALQGGRIKSRLRLYYIAFPCPDDLNLCPRADLWGSKLAIDGIKVFSDGSLGSRSAWLNEDYTDRPYHRGAHAHSDESLEEIFIKARDLGYQVAIHVIGDAAVSQAVRTIEKVLGSEKTDRRWRLEHYQLADPNDHEKVLNMGLVVSIQSVGLMTDISMAVERLGQERIKRAYAWREVIDRGGLLINGSDCPVESANPFLGIYAAVSRKDLKGQPKGGFFPAQALTRLEALSSYTVWAAMAAFQEKNLGSLEEGKFCDFTVIDRDLLTCPERAIASTRVLATVVGGEAVWVG